MGPCRLLKTIFAQFLGKYRVVSALFGKIERLTFTGTFDAFQHLVKSHSFKQICFPHRSEMGVLKSFPDPKYRWSRRLQQKRRNSCSSGRGWSRDIPGDSVPCCIQGGQRLLLQFSADQKSGWVGECRFDAYLI